MTNFFFGRGVAEVLLLPIELPHSREYWDAVTHIWEGNATNYHLFIDHQRPREFHRGFPRMRARLTRGPVLRHLEWGG